MGHHHDEAEEEQVPFRLKGASGAGRHIVVTAAKRRWLDEHLERQWRRPPTAAESDRFVADFVREEVLYREALTLGLDRDDLVVRRRLVQKMEMLARFGTDFAGAVFRAELGGWSGPVASAYGHHLVYVTRRAAAQVPDFAEVAGRIATDLDVARRAGALDRIYDQVRDAYQVEIEPDPADQPAHPPHLHDHAERTRA